MGGAWGGVAAGVLEAATIASTSGALGEFGFVPYAVIGYALLGAVIGAGVAIGLAILRRVIGARLPTGFGLAAAAAFASLAVIVGQYHVNLRLFHEELSPFTAGGAAAYAGLLLLAAVGAALALVVGRRLGRSRRPSAFAAGALLGVVVLALVVGRLRTPSDTLRGQPPTARPPAGAPNVILIIADTLRADALSAYGGPVATPAMDRLARDGVRFTRAYAQSSWTRPSIASILTGLHPASHGATTKAAILPDRVQTLAEAFRAAGYWTSAFVSNINIAPVFNFQQGFTEYTYLAPSFYFWASDSSARLALYRLLRVVRERFFATRIYSDNFYQDAAQVTERTLGWLEGAPRQPFFLLVHYMDPHDPYFEVPYNGRGVARVTQPNPPASRRDELLRLYHENVRYLDGFIATLWQRLEAQGLYAGSAVLLVADHGEEFLEHGGWWHGTTLYEEQIHVPLLVKRPAEAAPGSVVEHAVRTVDVAPTLLAAAGLPRPRAMEGDDLFTGSEPPALFADEELEGNLLAAIRVGDWKLITANPNNPRGLQTTELYDLRRDPAERNNLAASETTRVAELRGMLARRRSGTTGIGGS
jgi:arylsulfatase A-like enzyme